ncbi:hypothetical protein [Sporisorium scitamineum]|uniref:Glutaredoxin-like protein n=1 Tax=Sporisorium scitamineum TaxID=49012 RepID=A0A0F7RX04_9BASI|nr:hypothetical protein [Sporisorium scitamineum]
MYTATDCQLCDVMKHKITKASGKVPIQLSTFNIRDDSLPDVHLWRRKYQYDIPVLHLDDRGELLSRLHVATANDSATDAKIAGDPNAEIFRHRVTAQQLIEKLQQEQSEATPNQSNTNA